MSGKGKGIQFELTDRQKRTLMELNTSRPSPQGSEEDHTVKLQGYVKGGKLIVENLAVEYMHRWMDCHDRGQKPGTIKSSKK